jgi:uncharacterized lipoprotein YajG
MKVLILTLSLVFLAGCAAPTTLKSPCVGVSGSPCDRTPLEGRA